MEVVGFIFKTFLALGIRGLVNTRGEIIVLYPSTTTRPDVLIRKSNLFVTLRTLFPIPFQQLTPDTANRSLLQGSDRLQLLYTTTGHEQLVAL